MFSEKLSEIDPGIKDSAPEWFDKYFSGWCTPEKRGALDYAAKGVLVLVSILYPLFFLHFCRVCLLYLKACFLEASLATNQRVALKWSCNMADYDHDLWRMFISTTIAFGK